MQSPLQYSLALRCGETVVLDDENHVTELKTELRASHFLAMEAHNAPIWSGREPEVDLVMIRCRARIFALAPLLYPNVVASVSLFLEFGVRFCKATPEQQKQEERGVRSRPTLPCPGWAGPSRVTEGDGGRRQRDRSQEQDRSRR